MFELAGASRHLLIARFKVKGFDSIVVLNPQTLGQASFKGNAGCNHTMLAQVQRRAVVSVITILSHPRFPAL